MTTVDANVVRLDHLAMPELATQARVIAPDMVGFGFSERPAGQRYDMDAWVGQAVALLEGPRNTSARCDGSRPRVDVDADSGPRVRARA